MITELVEALKTDEDYREGWVANIACAIMDTKQQPGESLHSWRNRCAKTFINRLTDDRNDDMPGMMALAASVEPYTGTGRD